MKRRDPTKIPPKPFSQPTKHIPNTNTQLSVLKPTLCKTLSYLKRLAISPTRLCQLPKMSVAETCGCGLGLNRTNSPEPSESPYSGVNDRKQQMFVGNKNRAAKKTAT